WNWAPSIASVGERRQTGHRPDGVDGVGIGWVLVGSVAADAGEAECHSARIASRDLDAVERHFHDELRTHVDDVLRFPGLPPLQLLRLPSEEGVGHALERLSDHHEAVLSPGAEVEVGQPTLATPVTPFGGEDHEV